MARVYRGWHPDAHVEVAVKVLVAQKVRDPSFLSSFADEVRAVAALSHPGSISVYDYGYLAREDIAAQGAELVPESPFLVMELAPGGSLEHRLAGLDWLTIRRILVQLLEALAHAHARGLIHRDIKPGNVLCFDEDGGLRVKLTDFGISHAVGTHVASTGELTICGTPLYMAPEQFQNQAYCFGPWTDLYAVGCMAFQLVTGQVPFPVDHLIKLFTSHLSAPRPPLLTPHPERLPAGLETWIHRLIDPEPERRFRHAADARQALLELSPPADPRPLPLRGEAPAPTTTLELNASRTWSVAGLPTLLTDTLDELSAPTKTSDSAGRSTLPPESAAPPLPTTWRTLTDRQEIRHLRGVGAGLFGLRQPPLVGRLAERDRLWRYLRETVTTGSPQAVVLQGPTGCGKSRLASWLCYRAAELGVANYAVAYHSASPGPVSPAASMVRRLLGLSIADGPAALEERFPAWNPEDREVLGELMRGDPGALSVEQIYAHSLLREAIEEAAERRPLILSFDDVHFGAPSLSLIEQLLRQEELPLLILCTVDEELLATRPDEAAALESLVASEGADSLALPPLSEEEHRDLVGALIGLDYDLAEHLIERTAGNPTFLVELVGDWIATGLLRPGPRGFVLAADTLPPIPKDLRQAWEERLRFALESSPPDWPVALYLAAFLGTEFRRRDWIRAAEHAGLGVDLEALAEHLLNLRLLLRVEEGYAFAQAIARETLEVMAADTSAGDELVARLHNACSAAIREHYPLGSPGRADRLARHHLGAGRNKSAYRQGLMATEEAMCVGDYSRALHNLMIAEQALGTRDPADSPMADPLLFLRMEIQRQRLFVSETDTQDLGRLLQTRGAELQRPLLLAHGLEIQARKQGNRHAAVGFFERALDFYAEADDVYGLCRCMEGLAWTLVLMGRLDDGERYYQEILALLPDPKGREIKIVGDTLNGMAEIRRRRGDFVGASEYLDTGEALARRARMPRLLVDIYSSRAELAREEGRFDEALALYDAGHEIIRRLTGFTPTVYSLNRALTNLGRGDLLAVEEVLADPSFRVPAHLKFIGTLLRACVALFHGDGAQGYALLNEGLSLSEEQGIVEPDSGTTLEILAGLALDAGALECAELAIANAVTIWTTFGNQDAIAQTRALQQAIDERRGADR